MCENVYATLVERSTEKEKKKFHYKNTKLASNEFSLFKTFLSRLTFPSRLEAATTRSSQRILLTLSARASGSFQVGFVPSKHSQVDVSVLYNQTELNLRVGFVSIRPELN